MKTFNVLFWLCMMWATAIVTVFNPSILTLCFTFLMLFMLRRSILQLESRKSHDK